MSARAAAAPPAETAAAPDLFSKFDALIAQRQALLDTGVKDPFSLVMEKVLSPTRAIVSGKETILLGTYNYMGMTFDPDVIAAGKKALDEFGSGTTGSRVLNGTYQGHKECEQALRDFYAMDHAMVFSTGYQANLGVIATIAGKGDYVVLDIDSHASIYDGCAMGNAEIVPFRHNDVTALEKRLAAPGALEVQRDRALAGVLRQERSAHQAAVELGIGAELAGKIARPRRLDLDHLGAELRQLIAAEWPGQHIGEVENPQASEKPGHIAFPPCSRGSIAHQRAMRVSADLEIGESLALQLGDRGDARRHELQGGILLRFR